MDASIPGSGSPRSAANGVTVAVDPVALVTSECITVTSAMRKHARWAHSSVSAILGGGTGASPRESLRPTAGRTISSDTGSKPTRARAPSIKDDIGIAGRWGLRGKKGQSMQDNPLLTAFARLRTELKRCKDIHTIDAPSILHPFLQVIRSSSTSAPITSLALIAITKFFAYSIINYESPQLPLGMQMLSAAVTHCRFEATDSATDEIVLFRILKLMEWMVIGSGGEVLGDESMCEMMETGISMCCQTRLSELLRRAAEVSMVTMCQTIFQRLKKLEISDDEVLLETKQVIRNGSLSEGDKFKMEPTMDGEIVASKKEGENSQRSSESLDMPRDKGGGSETTLTNGASQHDLTQVESNKSTEIKPYSLPSIRELFRVLVDLLDPHDKQHNDTMRVMALRIVDVALEVAGPCIASHPSLAALAQDTLCRHLFQLVRSENVAILNESLRVAGTLIATCRTVLKLQQELYLSYIVACLHPRVEIPTEPGIDPSLYSGVPQAPRLVRSPASQSNSGRATPVPIKDRQRLGMEGGMRKPDAREAMVESVGALVRMPSFMVELFVNYDCDINRSDLCLDMVGLLSRNAFPDAATWSTTNVPPLCLDALLGYIQTLAERIDDEPQVEGLPDKDQLREQRSRKKVVIKGATKFNESPRAGIAYLTSHGIIDNPDDPQCVATFLKDTSRLDKKVIGDFVSKKGSEALLTAFLNTFDFANLRVDEALRQLLNSFRLPGESALIERIVNEFASRYFKSATPTEIADEESLFVLTYAIIMLNTDQHNPNVKAQNRMGLVDFSRNLRGVNNKEDFDPVYLQDIYDSIKTREIILPEEHDNKNSFDHAWKELLFKIQSTSNLDICQTNHYDADMFAATWQPVVATLSYVFMSATDDTVFNRIVGGFDQCAQLASKYGLHEALDQIVYCLSSISTLAAPTLPSTALNTEVQANNDKRIMVSETAVKFGRDFKAMLATVVLSRVVLGHERAIRDGWSHLVHIILNLFVNSLVTTPYASVSSHDDLPPIPLQNPAQALERGERNQEGGLFSAFTSYVSSFTNDEPPEPSDQEIEYTLCAIDCITASSFDQLFLHITELPVESLRPFITALLAQIPEESSPRVIVVKPEVQIPKPVRTNEQKAKQAGPAYEPSLVFILEFATLLAARDSETIAEIGKDVADALQSVVRDAAHVHPLVLTRAIYYLLSFLRATHEHDFIRIPVVLHTISKLDGDILKQAAVFIVKGLSLCLKGPSGLRNEIVNSPDFWLILQAVHAIPEAAQTVFDFVAGIVEGTSAPLTSDNYQPAISLLNDFATTGSQGALEERKREEQRRASGRSAKPKVEKPSEAVVRGVKAMQIVYQMTGRTPQLINHSQLPRNEAWNTYWSPPFLTLTTHSLNPCRQIRSQALSSLQRVLLSPSLGAESGNNITQISTLFTEVLFPLIGQLLKPEVWHSDPAGMGETRLRSAVLCCKVYLRFLDTLLTSPAPPSETQADSEIGEGARGVALWAQILDNLERLVKSGGHNDGMEDAVPETIKNIVLVMANGGYIATSQPDQNTTPLQKSLWDESWTRLERFLPGLMGEVFPNVGAAAKESTEGKNADEKENSNEGDSESASTSEEKSVAERTPEEGNSSDEARSTAEDEEEDDDDDKETEGRQNSGQVEAAA